MLEFQVEFYSFSYMCTYMCVVHVCKCIFSYLYTNVYIYLHKPIYALLECCNRQERNVLCDSQQLFKARLSFKDSHRSQCWYHSIKHLNKHHYPVQPQVLSPHVGFYKCLRVIFLILSLQLGAVHREENGTRCYKQGL